MENVKVFLAVEVNGVHQCMVEDKSELMISATGQVQMPVEGGLCYAYDVDFYTEDIDEAHRFMIQHGLIRDNWATHKCRKLLTAMLIPRQGTLEEVLKMPFSVSTNE